MLRMLLCINMESIFKNIRSIFRAISEIVRCSVLLPSLNKSDSFFLVCVCTGMQECRLGESLGMLSTSFETVFYWPGAHQSGQIDWSGNPKYPPGSASPALVLQERHHAWHFPLGFLSILPTESFPSFIE